MKYMRFMDGTPYPCVICTKTPMCCGGEPIGCLSKMTHRQLQRAEEELEKMKDGEE